MKAINSTLLALALAAPLIIAGGAARAADQSVIAVRVAADWVCYYDRETLELKFCQWE